MRKLGKIVGIFALVMVVIVAGGAIMAKVLFTPERIRAIVVPMAQEQLGREVSLERIEFSIFSGIVLEGVQVKEENGEDNFIRAERALLRYRLWPLLKLRLEVDEIALLEAHIRIVRHADANFNFSDLLGEQDDTATPMPTAQTKSTAETESTAAGAAAAAISVHIANLSVKNGTLEFVDHAVAAPRTHRYEISNFNLNARGIALRQDFPVELSCDINGAALKVTGQINLLQRTLDGEVKLTRLDVEDFAPYFASAIPGTLQSLVLSAQLKVDATPTVINSAGEITFDDISLNLDAIPDAPIDSATFVLNYTTTYKPTAAVVELANATLNYNGIKAEIQGDVRNIDSTPTLNLNLNTPAIDVATLLQALPPQLIASAQDLNPSGTIRIQGHLKGEASAGAALLRQAKVQLAEVEVKLEGMRPRLDGVLILADARAYSENLTLKVGPNVAQMELEIPNLFATPLKLTHIMRAQRFNLDALLASAAAPAVAADKSASKQKKDATPEELGPFDIPLDLAGSVTIGEALYQGLSITNFAMQYRLRGNVLEVENVSGSVAEGSFTQQAQVDLRRRGLKYNGKTHVEGVQIAPLITALAPESAGTVFGALNLDLEFNGTGTLIENVKKNLIATGTLNVLQARISGARLTEELANFLNLEQLHDINFHTIAAQVNVRDAVAHIESTFSGTNMRARPKGTVALDGSLDLGLNARLAPRLAQELDRKGHIAGFLTDDEGWALLPVKVKGTAAQPRISLDQSALKQQATQKAVENLTQRLLDKIAPAQEPVEEEGTDQSAEPVQKDPTRKLIDDAFKGIFGR
ncbi:MAG: AsmA family protein [Desulfuromonadaceae bacterium]|nr:AsmA family protein [Desulfuromonadaceae bacterium]